MQAIKIGHSDTPDFNYGEFDVIKSQAGIPPHSQQLSGFLGAEAPKQREKDREGRGEGKKKTALNSCVFPSPQKHLHPCNLLQIKRTGS